MSRFPVISMCLHCQRFLALHLVSATSTRPIQSGYSLNNFCLVEFPSTTPLHHQQVHIHTSQSFPFSIPFTVSCPLPQKLNPRRLLCPLDVAQELRDRWPSINTLNQADVIIRTNIDHSKCQRLILYYSRSSDTDVVRD
jgi:hypothetical protein